MLKIGKQIKSLAELQAACDARQAVYCPYCKSLGRYQPAAWVINLSGGYILSLIQRGLFIYEKKEKRTKDGESKSL